MTLRSVTHRHFEELEASIKRAEVDGELTRRQVRLLKGQIDDRRFDLVRDLVPDPPRSRLAILQSFDPTLLVSAVPVVERRSRDPDWSQCPADRERRLFHQFDDLELLGCGIPHEASSPIPENAFFEQAVFDQDLSQGLLELARLSLELLDLVRGRLTRRVASEPFLARLQELLRPTVVQVLIDPFLAAQLSNAVLAAQAFQHDADLLFSGMMPACGSANIPDCLFSALRYALARLSHRCSSAGLR